jgi:predicted nucleic acid-binding protein
VAAASGATGLIDPDVLIDATRGVAQAVSFLAAQRSAGGIHISLISSMELAVGCRNAAELAQLRRFLRRVTVIPVTAPVSQTALDLIETFYLSHGLLIPDALIAATALEHRLPLFTRNTRHFHTIPQLTLIRPY